MSVEMKLILVENSVNFIIEVEVHRLIAVDSSLC